MVGSQASHPFGSRLSSWDAQRLGSRAHLQASMWEDGELNSSGEACMDLSLACGQRGVGPRGCAGGREGGLLQGTVPPLISIQRNYSIVYIPCTVSDWLGRASTAWCVSATVRSGRSGPTRHQAVQATSDATRSISSSYQRSRTKMENTSHRPSRLRREIHGPGFVRALPLALRTPKQVSGLPQHPSANYPPVRHTHTLPCCVQPHDTAL